jgi:2,4-dienoyl-CoA reductase-like NADH-dependent reductase (Old Yellow Enzyme family)
MTPPEGHGEGPNHPILSPRPDGGRSSPGTGSSKRPRSKGRPENLVGDRLVEFHRLMGAGGVGLTTVAYCAVSPEGSTDGRPLLLRPRGRARFPRQVMRLYAPPWVAASPSLLRQPDLVERWGHGVSNSSLCVHCNKCVPTIYRGIRCGLTPPVAVRSGPVVPGSEP